MDKMGVGIKEYAEIVLLEVNLDKVLHYHIPENLRDKIAEGTRVLVPFKRKVVTGCVVGFLAETNIENLRDIKQLIDIQPLLSPGLIELTRWISDYYLCPWGRVLNYVIPRSKGKGRPKVEKVEKVEDFSSPSIIPSSALLEDYNFSSSSGIPLKNFKNKEEFLSLDLEELRETDKKYQPFLFCPQNFGEKVEVYSQFIQKTLERGRQVIILTPTEVQLSALAKIFKDRYGERAIILGEKTGSSDRYAQWLKIKNSSVDIVLGRRSAIFLPLDKLGLLIIDQEHSDLYKEERMPRYNAVTVALKRAELEKVPLLLSSPTPSLESYWKVQENNYRKVDFVSARNLARKENSQLKIKVVDMNKEKGKKKLISYELQQAISRVLKEGKQVILFLNKRGFSHLVICPKCGYVPKCPDCHHTLSYRLDLLNKAQLVCSCCGGRIKIAGVCPQCGSKDLKPLGWGTQRLESEIKKMFPRARIRRIDRDAITKEEQYLKFLEDFARGKVDLLIGTQKVTKEANFKNVDLVGIVSADTLLNLPDYRSGEKSFQLLSEIISSFKEIESLSCKEVILQTFNPDHHSIIALKEQNYDYFYQREMVFRKELDYPPFTHLIKMEVKGKEKDSVEQRVKLLIDYLNSLAGEEEIPEFKLLGEKNLLVEKVRNVFKAQFIIKVKELEKFNKAIKRELNKKISDYFDRENRLTIDVDPVEML